jgi:MbtH protein
MSVFDDQDAIFTVVVNHEEQYSIWPTSLPEAPGWREVGVTGTKDVCLQYIDKVWTDMRPLSLREAMARQEQQ